MEQNIQEKLLIELYTLRAGISSVAILSEQIEQKREMKNLELTYPANDKSILSNQTSIHCTPKKYYINGNLNNNNIYNECLFNEIKISLKEKNKQIKTKKYFAFLIASLVFSVALFIVFIALTAVYSKLLPENNVVQIFGIIGIILTLFAGCYFGESLIKAFVNNKKVNALIEKYQNFLDEYPVYCDFVKKFEEINQKNIVQLTEVCNKILLVLKNEYSNLIDYNNWKYLDFVINSIEFNDVQNVNDAIVFINDKEDEIFSQSATILVGVEMQNKLSFDCKALCVAIDKNFEKISKNMGNLSENISFSTALLEKAEVTSLELMRIIESL